MGSSDW